MIPKYQVWDGERMHEVRSINFDEKYPGGFAFLTVPIGQHSVDTLFQSMHGVPDGRYDYDLKLRQFTGLLDKNGKEIYVGDVIKKTIDNPNNLPYKTDFNIKNDQFIGVVIYQDGMFFIEDYERTTGLELFSETDTNEVIGNIYEDKDSFAFEW